MSRRGRAAIQDVLKWSGDTAGCPGVVGRPRRMSESGREALADGQEWSGGLPGGPGVVVSS